jgi:hypothetical protein
MHVDRPDQRETVAGPVGGTDGLVFVGSDRHGRPGTAPEFRLTGAISEDRRLA